VQAQHAFDVTSQIFAKPLKHNKIALFVLNVNETGSKTYTLDLKALLARQFGKADMDKGREAAIAGATSWQVRDVWEYKELPPSTVVGGVLTTDAVATRDSRFYVLTPTKAAATKHGASIKTDDRGEVK